MSAPVSSTRPAGPATSFDRLIRFLLWGGVAALLVWVARLVEDVLLPLVLGLLFAYLLDPLVRRVERRLRSRPLAVFACVGTAVVIVVAGFAIIVPIISAEVHAAVAFVRSAVTEDSPIRQRLVARMPPEFLEGMEAAVADPVVHTFLHESIDVPKAFVAVAKKVLPGLWGLFTGALSLLGILLQVLMVVVYLIFILLDFRRFQATWTEYLPAVWRSPVVSFLGDFDRALSRYFRGQFAVAVVVGLLFALSFMAIGLKLGLLFGLIIGVLNMVPYLQLAALPPALLLAIMTAVEREISMPGYIVAVFGVFGIVQLLQDMVIAPRVMGDATGLRPVIILFCVLFWGKLLGFLGLVLAIPLTCVGLATYHRFIASTQAPA
jgi:predicted PurR-regulated permease PerM